MFSSRSRFEARLGRQYRGFTLVELLVVMGIIMLLLALSVGAYAIMLSRRGLRGGVDITQGAFIKMREEATSSGQPVFLVVEHWEEPMRLRGWHVEHDPLPAPLGTWKFDQIGDDIYLPRGIYMHTPNWDWWEQDVNTFLTYPPSQPFASQLNELCTVTGAGTPNYDFGNVGAPHGGKAYVIVFHPSGGIDIVGRADIKPWEMDSTDPLTIAPNGDMVMTNQIEAYYIDINPTTGRLRWTAYEVLPIAP